MTSKTSKTKTTWHATRPAGYVRIKAATDFTGVQEADAWAQNFRADSGRVVALVHAPFAGGRCAVYARAAD